MKRVNKIWTEDEEEILRGNLHLTNKDLAWILNRTEYGVSKKKARMGLTKPKEKWTEGEKERMERLWYGINENCHKNIGRSKTAFKKKGIKMGLGSRYNADGFYLTTSDVGKMLGMHPTTVRKYVREGLIQATFYGKRRIARISPDEMIRFSREHQDKINRYEMDVNSLQTYLNTEYSTEGI